MTKMASYDFSEHIHRYAVWTAARAVQRGFAKTATIWSAIDTIGLKNFAQKLGPMTERAFDREFDFLCSGLQTAILPTTCSYGQAAKIISIYLKTSVVLTSKGEAAICDVIHPPIDSILLKNLLPTLPNVSLSIEEWTQFEREDYWKLVDAVRKNGLLFNWQLEVYWQPAHKIGV